MNMCENCIKGKYCTNHYHKNICSFCKKEYMGKKRQINCSHECAGKNNGYKKGSISCFKGKVGVRISKFKGKKRPELQGSNHPRYILDRSKLVKRQERNDSAYQNWRSSVWKRDNFKCKINNNDCCGKITAHHILPWRNYVELRYEVNNGITLCQFHHPLKRNDEKKLSPYFIKLVAEMK